MKPILMNTEMVRAILDGRKTVTRRVVKPELTTAVKSVNWNCDEFSVDFFCDNGVERWLEYRKPPCSPGDILYVRETWTQVNVSMGMGLKRKRYIYRANYSDAEAEGWKWRPSIHMPREAARIFLRVKDVRVDRLQKMTYIDAWDEGLVYKDESTGREVIERFGELWDSTIKPADRDKYGWEANPMVWVISFKRIDREGVL